MKNLLIFLALAVAVGGGGYWYWHARNNTPPVYRTVDVERGELRATINATGTVEPEEVVDVGAQVAGQIIKLGPDPRDNKKTIDYGTPVEEGTILALVDDAIYRSQVEQAQAQVEQAEGQVASAEALVTQAEANVQRAVADLGQMQAKLFQADRDWVRAQDLRKVKGAISDTEYDTDEAVFKTAKANVGVGEAAVAQAKAGLGDAKANVLKAKAGLSDAKANLRRAETNLGYCTIKSPVKGVIIDRRINVGQTVVSSLNSPSLFLIAKDLRRMQVWASVNEADVGGIRSGQAVRFTVDAFGGTSFRGVVAPDQPRLNASMTQNVVSYTVVVNTDNSSGKLIPYLTANLEFEVSRKTDVILVPNGALRWRPTGSNAAAAGKPGARPGGETSGSSQGGDKGNRGTVWVLDNGAPRPVDVVFGTTDGTKTEIVEGDLKPGDQLVVGEVRKDNGTAGTANPFAPQMFGGKSKQS